MKKLKTPRLVRRHLADFTLAAADPSWDELARSEPAIPRLGATIWYKPGGGRRRVALTHRDGELRVESRWEIKGRCYAVDCYRGSDVYAAVDAANAAFDQLAQEGYKIHADVAGKIEECFGFHTLWVQGPLFSVKSALAVIDYHEKRHAQELADQAAELAAAEARGLVASGTPMPLRPRSRTSSLAELQRAGA